MHLGRLAVLAGLAGSVLLIAPRASAADSDDESKSDHAAEKSSDADKDKDKDADDKDAAEKAEKADSNADLEATIPAGPRTPEQQELDRYNYLSAELARVTKSTESWYAGWTTAFGLVAIGQYTTAAAAPNTGMREFALVNAVNATLGFGAMLIAPNTLSGARERLEVSDTAMPQGIYERRRRAEYYLRATKAEEAYWHSPVPLVLVAITSGIGGAVLWGSYDNLVAGIATLGSGVALGVIQMLTRPSAATQAWKRYSNRYNPTTPTIVAPDQVDMFLSRITIAPGPMGGSLSYTF
jgi:hypothetical protein